MLVGSTSYTKSSVSISGCSTSTIEHHADLDQRLFQAFRHEEAGEYQQAAKIYAVLVQSTGDVKAQVCYRLGLMFIKGLGVEQDDRLAFEHMKFAADNNEVAAQYQLGVMYKEGRGVEVNQNQAMNYFSQAAESDYELAHQELSNATSLFTHRVYEKTYKVLQQDELDQSVIVPGVSGCAAIKCSVVQDDKFVQSVTLHSDGTNKSMQCAREIAEVISSSPGGNKSVSILVITNGFHTLSSEHHTVVGMIESRLRAQHIPYQSEYKKLFYGTKPIIDIDVSGTHEKIHLRYQKQYAPEITKDEAATRQQQLREYQHLYKELGEYGLDKARIRGGGIRGTTFINNPYYVRYISPKDWGTLSTDDQAQKITEAKTMLHKYQTEKSGFWSELKRASRQFFPD